MVQVAAVTMVHSERDMLPVWLRHYAAQVGLENCFVVDHGSDDGSTTGLGRVNVVRLPRSSLDDRKRTAFMSEFCGNLLKYYDAVIHSDVDELVVADPAYYTGLSGFCATMPAPVMTAIGLDVHHSPVMESPINPARPISQQRPWVRFVSPFCKPAAISRPVTWAPGFHSCDAPIHFGRLFLFHLKQHDAGRGLRRLHRTRALARTDPTVPWHQAITDDEFTRSLVWHWREMPHVEEVSLEMDDEPLKGWLDGIVADQAKHDGQQYRLSLDKLETALWRLPERFVGTF